MMQHKKILIAAALGLSFNTLIAQAATYSITDLGTLGGTRSFAYGINNNGQVVGVSNMADYASYHAFLYNNGTMSDLGALGGTSSSASGINNNGQVVGNASTAGNTASHAFLYSNGAMTDLGTLGGSNSAANGINNNGQVVGNSFAVVGNSPFQTQDAFLYSNGKMIDLNSLIDANSGWTLVDATAINDKGQIVGLGLNAQGLEKSFLLTPNAIPIPSAIWLFGSALVGFGLFGRDKAA